MALTISYSGRAYTESIIEQFEAFREIKRPSVPAGAMQISRVVARAKESKSVSFDLGRIKDRPQLCIETMAEESSEVYDHFNKLYL